MATATTSRQQREAQLWELTKTESGKEEVAALYRQSLNGEPPMPVAVYSEMIWHILAVEFPPRVNEDNTSQTEGPQTHKPR